MAANWACLGDRSPNASSASAWMHDTTDNDADANVNTASSWARIDEFNGIPLNAASNWAALSPGGTDSEVDDVDEVVDVTTDGLPSAQQLEQHVESICETTTIADIETTIRNLNKHLKDADTVNEMAWVGNQYDKLLSQIALKVFRFENIDVFCYSPNFNHFRV